jgi:hypothetical protein
MRLHGTIRTSQRISNRELLMNGTKAVQKWVFVAAIVFISVAGWLAIQSEERTPAKQRTIKAPTSQREAETPATQPAVKAPDKRVRPAVSSKARGQLRSLEHALKQVSEMTRDSGRGTLSKRDALVRAYAQAIASANGMARAKYTPDSAKIRSWMRTTQAAGGRLGSLASRYSSYSRGRHYYSSRRRTSGGSDKAWHNPFCKELSRQKLFVSGLKPDQATGRTRNARLPRLP